MTDELYQQSDKKYKCTSCYYSTSRKSHYDRHVLSLKHYNTDQTLTHTGKIGHRLIEYFHCECGKKYQHRQSLFTHRKKCSQKCPPLSSSNDKDIIIALLNQNSQLQHQIMNLCQDKNTGITNINTVHNKTFNLNVFLNEQCKDAMNIMEFVDSLNLQLSDLENVGKQGFVEGISNIIVKNLNALDVHMRPVHCSDSKREVMYIKDEDKWEKDNDEKLKLRKVIKHIAHKNSKLIPQFKEKYPDCGKSYSNKSDQYNKLIIEAMGGVGDNDDEKENKIIKKIAKEVMIAKY